MRFCRSVNGIADPLELAGESVFFLPAVQLEAAGNNSEIFGARIVNRTHVPETLGPVPTVRFMIRISQFLV